VTMASPDTELLREAEAFADDIADLLDRTVTVDAAVRAQVRGARILVGAFQPDGEATSIPLQVRGEHRLDLRVRFQCEWDFARRFLAIASSEFALKLPHVSEPLIRFDYLRSHTWSPAHVQLHGESAALGWLHAFTGSTKPPKVQELHLPVGGKRLRPSVEDVLEFAIRDLGVDPHPGAQQRIDEGRTRWRRRQVMAAIRDVVKDDPEGAPSDLQAAIAQAVQDVADN